MNPLACSIATPARTAELLLFMEHFLRFRTVALRDLLSTPPDITHFRSREIALLDRLGRYWGAFQQQMCDATLPLPRALDTSVKRSPKTECELRNRFAKEWLSSNGLDLQAMQSVFERDAFQELKRRIALHYGNDRAVGGWDKRRYWEIFSTALKRSSEQSNKQLVRLECITWIPACISDDGAFSRNTSSELTGGNCVLRYSTQHCCVGRN